MLQFCETLITKINEWQKAILELEELTDEFLGSGDEKIKAAINNKKQEIINCQKEYQELAYPELPNGQNLFWPEKELLEELTKKLNTTLDNFIRLIVYAGASFAVEIKNSHLYGINLQFTSYLPLSELPVLNFSLFQRLEKFNASETLLKLFPKLPYSIKDVLIYGNPEIQIPLDLTILKNLRLFCAYNCNLKKLPFLPKTVEFLDISDNKGIQIQDDLVNLENLNTFVANNCGLNKIPKLNENSIEEISICGNELLPSERKRIKKKYPYVKIIFRE